MNNIFNPDNKFFSFKGRVADLMILNLLCIVCCIPVVTATGDRGHVLHHVEDGTQRRILCGKRILPFL